ncbi:MAG: hypothetical protein HY816_06270 [Candidatus Wallbacteria bacterium]|nr:hypothetical protein [Candidatus Wallbacteria bacterium]
MSGRVLCVAREQEAMLDCLRRHGRRGMRFLHVDRHCDMRGWVVDRAGRRGGWLHGSGAIDSGNVLAHAVAEGWIERVDWLHEPDAGREDDLGTFLTVEESGRWPWRLMGSSGPAEWRPFELSEWNDPSALNRWSGEGLGLDWDHFAPFPCSERAARRRMQEFLDALPRPWPELVFLCASPGYASAHLGLFDELVRAVHSLQGGKLEREESVWGGPCGAHALGRALTATRNLARAAAVGCKRLALGPG